MSGHVGDLSPKQNEALRKLKENAADAHRPAYDDYYYLRWLRARDFDVAKAETMMRKNLAFRRKYRVDTILEDYRPLEFLRNFFPFSQLGVDKEGCPVRFVAAKNIDLRGISLAVSRTEVIRYLVHIFEADLKEMERMSKQVGKVIERHSYIFDLSGYKLSQISNKQALALAGASFTVYDLNYPERMKVLYIINSPSYVNIILSLIRPFLSENTFKKFKTFGKDYKEVLLRDIDAEVLPKSMGGSRTDPDGNPECRTIINYGSFVSPEYYAVKNSQNSLESQPDAQHIKVHRNQAYFIEVPVSEVDSVLSWEYETEAKDIAVGLYRREGDDLEELVEPERVNCSVVPESGAYTCDKAGTYVLKFDNSYSWITSKNVFYRIKLTSAAEASTCEASTL